MGPTVNYSGYNIAPEVLNPELQDQLRALGLPAEQYTPESIEARQQETIPTPAFNERQARAAGQLFEEARNEAGLFGRLPEITTPMINQRTLEISPESYQIGDQDARKALGRERERIANQNLVNLEQAMEAERLGIDPIQAGILQPQGQSSQPAGPLVLQGPEDEKQGLFEPASLTDNQAQLQTQNAILNQPTSRPADTGYNRLDSLYNQQQGILKKARSDQEAINAKMKEDRDKKKLARDEAYESYKQELQKSPQDRLSMTQKILSGIALVMGGIADVGSDYVEGNSALAGLDAMLADARQRQLDQVQAARGDVEKADNQLATLMSEYQSESAALLQLASLQNQEVGNMILQESEKIKRAEAKAEAQKMADYYFNKARNEAAAADQKEFEVMKGRYEFAQELSDSQGYKPKEEELNRWLPGVGLALNKDAYNKIQEETGSYFKAIPILDRLEELTDGFQKVDPSRRAEIGQLVSLLTGQLRVPVVGPGAFTNEERAFIQNDIVGDSRKLLSFDSLSRQRFNTLKEYLTNAKTRTITQYGVIPFNERQTSFDQNLVGRGSAAPEQTQTPMVSNERQVQKARYQQILNNPGSSPQQKRLAQEALQTINSLEVR